MSLRNKFIFKLKIYLAWKIERNFITLKIELHFNILIGYEKSFIFGFMKRTRKYVRKKQNNNVILILKTKLLEM